MLDAGNSLVGDKNPAQKSLGQSSVAAMNLMGYDAMALGTKDLALGLNVLRRHEAEARFALLSANAVVSATGELVATPYVVREFDGQVVAVIGLSGGQGTGEIVVLDPLEAARAVVPEVATQADVIILLSQAGASTDRQIAQQVPGVDLIVSGGRFQFATPWRSEAAGTLLLHADEATPGHTGRRLGIARLAFDAQGQLIEHSWKRINLSPGIAEDPAMATWVQQQLNR